MKKIIAYLDVIIIICVALCVIWMYQTNFSMLIYLLALSVVAFFVEKIYVSRPFILLNVFVLPIGMVINEWQSLPELLIGMINEWQSLPDLFKYYCISGVIIGIAFLIAYCKKISIPAFCYKITYALFSMKTILSLYLSFLMLGSFDHQYFWYLTSFLLIVIWGFGVKRFNNAPPF